VVITLAATADRERLQAQLQLLDHLRRPRLLTVPPEQPANLAEQLEAGWQFDWLAARQPWRGYGRERLQDCLDALTALAAPSARARLLFSEPLLGPVGSLLAHNGALAASGELAEALSQAQALERDWLTGQGPGPGAVQAWLEQRGWRLESQSWQESLGLPLDAPLLRRWFDPEAEYRRLLSRQLDAAMIDGLQALFSRHQGIRLPQPLRHSLLLGQCPP
jgi:putative ATPase